MPSPKSLEIESRMLALRDDAQVAGLSRFFRTGPGQYGEGDRFLGAYLLGLGDSSVLYRLWLLREVGKRDGALLREYLTGTEEGTGRARYLIMPRTALRYAIEKFPEPERQRFLRPDSCTDARA